MTRRLQALVDALWPARFPPFGATTGPIGPMLDAVVELETLNQPILTSRVLDTSDRPGLLQRIDRHVRSRSWTDSATRREVLRRFDTGSAGPTSLMLAGMDGDGRTRARAVGAILAGPLPLVDADPPELRGWQLPHRVGSTYSPPNCAGGSLLSDPFPFLLPVLMLRTADWVPQVRAVARAGLVLRLAADPGTYLPIVVKTVRLVEGRTHGRFMAEQVPAALAAAPPTVREALAVSPDRAIRRPVVLTGLTHGWWSRDRLLAFVSYDPDSVIVGRVAEVLCRDAVWSGDLEPLSDLLSSARAAARAAAVIGLVRAGQPRRAADFLDDLHALVRAVAQDAARRCGIDVAAHYRAAVAGPGPSAGAAAGLGEAGTPADAALLRPLLTGPSARVRTQAARALRTLDPPGPPR